MKRLLFILICIFTVSSLYAQHVTEEQALLKAQEFLNRKVATNADGRHKAPRKVRMLSKAAQDDAYYIFNAEDNGGFVIVSGDDRTDEILGYSTEGNIDLDNMPENMRAWLKGYEEQINAIPANAKAAPARVPSHPAVEPLLTTKWGQRAPYNLQCPEEIPEGGTEPQHCITGCVATALAQIMYYWKWPQDFTTAIPAYGYGEWIWDDVAQTGYYTKSLPELPPTKFDWENMKDVYFGYETDATADAVAELMRYCGQSVKMNYGLWASGGGMYLSTLINYFGYDRGATFAHQYGSQYGHSIAEWDALIYQEIAAGRPIWYCGRNNFLVSHAFVCDGYDGDGSFHFNWGWNGYYDGYFKLNVHSSSDYLSYQSVIIGIQPPTGNGYSYSENCQINAYLWWVSDLHNDGSVSITLCYENISDQEVYFEGGLCLESYGLGSYGITGGQWIFSLFNNRKIDGHDSFEFYAELSSICSSLPDGEWKIAPAIRMSSESKFRWQKNYFWDYYYVTVVGGIITSVTHREGIEYKADIQIQPRGTLVTGETQRLDVKVRNYGEEINCPVYLFVSKTDDIGECQSMNSLAVEPYTEETIWFEQSFPEEGIYHVWITTDSQPSSSFFKILAQTDITISDPIQLYGYVFFNWNTMTGQLSVTNPNDMPYDHEVAVRIVEREPSNSDNKEVGQLFKSEIHLDPGESMNIEFPCPDLDIDKLYGYEFQYYKNPNLEKLCGDYWDSLYPELINDFSVNGIHYGVADNKNRYVFVSGLTDEVDEEVVIPSEVISPFDGLAYTVKGTRPCCISWKPNLKSVTFSEGITTIEEFSIYGCENLTTITLPTSINRIARFIVGDECPNLKSIHTKRTDPPLIASYYSGEYLILNEELYGNITLYVPIGSKKTYAKAWPVFRNIVEMNFDITIIDGTAFSNDEENFYEEINYTRSFNNTKWQSLYVPFEIPVTAELLEEFEFAYINAARQYDYDEDGTVDDMTIEIFKIKRGTLRANTPYLIQAKTTGEKTITVNDATLYATEENSIDCSTTSLLFTFTGSYSTLGYNDIGGCYLLGGGTWNPVKEGGSMKPMRFYLRIDSRDFAPFKAPVIRMTVFGEDDETTEIDASPISSPEWKEMIFDLQGRRVEHPEKGFYIINGKKVLVK